MSNIPEDSLFLSVDGSMKLPAFLVASAVPLLATGRWMIAVTTVMLGLVVALWHAMDEYKAELHDCSEAWTSKELVDKLERVLNNNDTSQEATSLECLNALSKLRGKQRQKKRASDKTEAISGHSTAKSQELELHCLQAVYLVLERLLDDRFQSSDMTETVFSLHTLVSKDPQVRECHLYEADCYGLDAPVKLMKKSLERSKVRDEPIEVALETMDAEIQRKACLLVGALADGSVDMATKLVDEGALEAVLEAVDWFRFHEDVANWALWATFSLCYEHVGNKAEFVRLGGIQVVCQTIRNLAESQQVARHGIATLFDVLRKDSNNQQTNVLKIREIALSAGLHDAVIGAMERFNDSIDIIMMGQDMLASTGYQGDIPQFQPTHWGEKDVEQEKVPF